MRTRFVGFVAPVSLVSFAALFSSVGVAACDGTAAVDPVDAERPADASTRAPENDGAAPGPLRGDATIEPHADAALGHADAGSTPDASRDGSPDAPSSDAAREADTPDASPFTTPGVSTQITAFDRALVCFGNGGVGPCSRTVDRQVVFPTTGAYSKIDLRLSLECPSNGCDPWDRFGSIYVVQPPTSANGPETLIELGRFMTPYGITAGVNAPPVWTLDVTDLRPLLVGTVTLRVFIDTWVPQGNAAQYGGGWLFGAKLEMTGGVKAKPPVVVLPIWPWRTTGKEPTQVVYGDARFPIETSVPPQTLDLPAGPTAWSIRSIITGHGQANLDNCAEFCSRNHTWTAGSTPNRKTVWRTDCSRFPSRGTYQYPRAGWCPGAEVLPWDFDVTSQVRAGRANTFSYGVDTYLNTCNGSAPNGGVCTGCPQGVSCAYNGGSHTQPFYFVSSLLIGYR